MKQILLYSFLFFLFLNTSALSAQELSADANTTLLLHFNNNTNGAQGETPNSSQNINYQAGVYQQGATFTNGNQLKFAAANNLNSTIGTFECWLQPFWGGNDVNSYTILSFGGGGGMLFQKDGANNLRAIFNRFSVGGNTEVGVALNVSDWVANQYYHIAYTWNSEKVELYVNGKLVDTAFFSYPIPFIFDSEFSIGLDGGVGSVNPLNGMLDEVRISNVVRSAEDIAATFVAGFSTISALNISPSNLDLWPTWEEEVSVNITTNLGSFDNVAPSIINWSSNNDAIASINTPGLIRGESGGNTNIIGTINSFTGQVAVNVNTPILNPVYETVDSDLSEPECAVEFMPVVILRYMPTTDGTNVDTDETGWTSSLDNLKTRIETFDKRLKFALSERTKFRGYNNPSEEAYLAYYVVDIINVYEPLPPGIFRGDHYNPDYKNILERFGAENYVNNMGVKEFWVWGYHHGDMIPVESNMSSPTTGDISNSFREEDLPIYDQTYVLYNYNFTRTQAEAIHNHGHQLEAMFLKASEVQDGNNSLFREQFVGWSGNNPPIGRCGDTHHPPNTTADYDYENTSLVESDIEDWRPDNSGAKTMVNSNTWGSISYNWPGGTSGFPQLTETQWYIYWMQNMPGKGNQIPHGSNWMSNWWEMVADWDATITNTQPMYATTMATNPACIDAPLALQFSQLEAIPLADFIQIQWAVESSATKNDFDILRKSEEETDFKWIGQVSISPFENTNKIFQFQDKTAKTNVQYYYQLRQKDQSGKNHFSNIVSAILSDGEFDVQLFPNPATEQVFITLNHWQENSRVQIELMNMKGQVLQNLMLDEVINSSISISLKNLDKQIYWIKITGQQGTFIKKLIVQ